MDLSGYQTLTGITVAAADQARVIAEIVRARRKLESLLGYTLDPALINTNLYNELGKTNSELSCPIVDTSTLLPPDPVVTAYRLYNFSGEDPYMHIDPFTTLNAVKLVYLRPGAAPNGVTVKTFDVNYLRTHRSRDTWSKYLHEFYSYYSWHCGHNHDVQLAVDAVWQFATIPDDLKEIWADVVTFNSDIKKGIKSESILTHSYTRFDNVSPETLPESTNIIGRYAGPHGLASRTVVV